MSAYALSDIIMLPESEKKTENSTNGGFHKPQIENNDGNVEEKRKSVCPLVETSPNGNGTEAATAEVEYIESENLGDVEDLDTSLEARMYFNL